MSLVSRISRSQTLLSIPTRRLSALSAQLLRRRPSIAPPLTPLSPSPFRRMATTEIPKTMSGVVIGKTGGTEVLEYKTDLPVPQPKEGEILVKNEFIGVNYIDTYFRTGLYPAPSFPYMLGREASGVIQSTGPGTTHGLQPGDRVAYMSQATYAQYTAAPSLHALKIPAHIPSDAAAAALLQGLTALTLIREAYPAQKGDWILVHAAAGGVGLWLCQLLKAVGARVIGTAGSEAKRELARQNGAEVLVDYKAGDWVKKVKDTTGGEGVKAVYGGVGRETFDGSLDALARKGTLASFGNASGAVEPLTIARLSAKNVKLLRPTLFIYLATREEFEHYTSELFALMEEHNFNVKVHEIYPLKEVARAHEDIEGRRTTGKLLLQP